MNADNRVRVLHIVSHPIQYFAPLYRRLASREDIDLTVCFYSDAGLRAAYDPGFAHAGEPVLVSEFGGLRVAGSGGWGWLEVKDTEEFVRSYGALVDALMEPGPVEGFCYTQLTDVQQEQNGLLTAERQPKVDPGLLRALTQTAKKRK